MPVLTAAGVILVIEKIGAPVHFAGHFYGATEALRVARERPELLRSLVVSELVFFGVPDDAGHPAYADARREELEMVALLQLADFAAIRLPVLLLRGAKGLDVIRHINEALASLLPNAETRAIAGGGQMAPLSHRVKTNALLTEFWQ